MSFRTKVERNEDALCWTCTSLDYEPIQHIDQEGEPILYPFPICSVRGCGIFKGFKYCKTHSRTPEAP